MTSAPDFGLLEPMLDATRRELHAVGVSETPGVVLADAGYWHQQQNGEGSRRRDAGAHPARHGQTQPGWTGGYHAFMRRVLATESGSGLYRRR
jgi:hypothetical protein